MRLRYLTYVFLALLAAMSGAFAQSLHRQSVGTDVQGKAQIGRYEIPLPPGTWTLIGTHQEMIQPLDGSMGRPFGHVVLARIENGALTGFIYANGPAASGGGHRTWDTECRRTDLYFVESDPNTNPREQTCLIINHYVRTWTAVQNLNKALADAYAWLNERPQIRKPSTMVVARFFNNRGTDYSLAEYNFSPEAFGFPPSRDRSWAGNDWHRDKLKQDPARDAFAQAVLGWAKTTQRQVLDGLIHRSTSVGTPLAFAAVARSGGVQAAAPAPVPAAARPLPPGHVVPAVGVRFVTVNGHFDVTKVEGMSITTVNSANAGATWQPGGLMAIAASARFDRAVAESIFPLALGKKVEFVQQAASGTDSWKQNLEVVRQETLTVDGRAYPVFVVEGRTEAVGPGMAEFVRKRTIWYAPEVGFSLRVREEQLAGPPQRMNSWEVTKIERPQ